MMLGRRCNNESVDTAAAQFVQVPAGQDFVPQTLLELQRIFFGNVPHALSALRRAVSPNDPQLLDLACQAMAQGSFDEAIAIVNSEPSAKNSSIWKMP